MRSEGYLSATLPADLVYQSDPVHVCNAWKRSVTAQYEVVSYGPFTYMWDGQGSVYISGSSTAASLIGIDDTIDAVTSAGTVSQEHWGTGTYWSALNITSILSPGANWVTIRIRDVYAGTIGTATPLYIMRVL